MAAPEEDDNSNCYFDFSLIDQFPVPGGELPSFEPDFQWSGSTNPFPGSTNLSKGIADLHGIPNAPKEDESRKRSNPGSCSDSKACREKKRRDKLNERFQELNEILDPGRSSKTDKTVILADAIRMVRHLRNEESKLKVSSQDLLVKINELKVEKNELRDEKLKLKADKESLEQQLKAAACFSPPAAFYPPAHPMIPVPVPGPTPVGGNKFMPFMGYQGVPMWQFASPNAVDISKDHVHRSPLA
ncbi:transcription factor ILR3-like [Rutidosis leptorrhynchoides]|uniref:transcription factor ILR3-like n=1 Tax=Rutidosis leptorrhynchoides TaxID=125765 RepID=UPI003A991273